MADVLKLLGARIRGIREEKEMTQEDLAFLCRTNQAHIGRIERGENNTSLEILCRIAEGLQVTLSERLDFSKELEVLPYDPQTVKAICDMRALPEQTRLQIVEIIKILSG